MRNIDNWSTVFTLYYIFVFLCIIIHNCFKVLHLTYMPQLILIILGYLGYF